MVFLEDLSRELEKKESKRKRIKKEFKFPLTQEEESEEEPESKTLSFKKPKFYFDWNKIINKLLLFSFLIFVFALIFLVVSNFLSKEEPKELSFDLIGPTEVSSLEENYYTFLINNFSRVDLQNISLSLLLSEGAYFGEGEEKEKVFELGELPAGTSTKVDFSLVFLNEGNKKESVKAIVRYKTKNKPYVFETSKEISVMVKNTPLAIIPSLPTSVFVLQPFEVKFKIINNSPEFLNNITVKIDPPQELNLQQTLPLSETLEWNFPTLNSRETKEITLLGYFKSLPVFPFFDIKISFNWRNRGFSLTQQSYKLNVVENPLKIELTSFPQSDSVNLGSSIAYTIKIKNQGKIPLKENVVKVTFDNLFDITSLRFGKNAYFSSFDNALYYNARYEPALLEIKPGEEVKLSFSISLFRSYPILGDKDKNFSAKVFVEFHTPSIPPEVRTANLNEYVIKIEDSKKIIGKFEIQSFLVYKDNLIENSGPFPLIRETPTTLNLHFKIKTIGEDFKDFSLAGKLPPYVSFTGKVGGDTLDSNFNYDNKTGEFSYYLANIPANVGYKEKEIDLVFQVVVLVPANLNPNFLELIPGFNYKVTSAFTNTNFTGFTDNINSSEIIYELK